MNRSERLTLKTFLAMLIIGMAGLFLSGQARAANATARKAVRTVRVR